jgi:hypothetical protein
MNPSSMIFTGSLPLTMMMMSWSMGIRIATLLNYYLDENSQASKPIRRLSEDSLVVDDRMVSWLVSESDFVLSYQV